MSATSTAVAAKKKDSVPAMLEKFKPEIARALPRHLDADRMLRIATTEFRKNPKLENCDPRSVFAAIIIASQLGLEPGILGQAFLVPYKSECQLIPGWQGYVDLVSRSGRANVWTGAVYAGDEFEYALGDRPYITHRPGDDVSQHPDNLIYVYSVGRVKGSEWPNIEVWTANKVVKHRDYYNKVGDKHYSYENFEMYARKVPLLQVVKYMPKSVELQRANDLTYSAERGSQLLDIKSASENTWLPPPADDTPGISDGSRVESLKDKLRGDGGTASAGKSTDAVLALEVRSLTTLKNINDRTAVDAAYADIVKEYTRVGIDIPMSVQAAKDDRIATLEQI